MARELSIRSKASGNQLRDPQLASLLKPQATKFHYSINYNPHTGHPVEFFISVLGKIGSYLDTELYTLGAKATNLMQGEFQDDLTGLRERDDVKVSHKRASLFRSRDTDPHQPSKVFK